MLEIIVYSFIGVIAGILGGMLGIGGGIVTVPALLFLFHRWNLYPEYPMQAAIATSLAAMIFTSASSAFAHYCRGKVLWRVFHLLAPGFIVGAAFGAWVAHSVPSRALELFFGGSIVMIGISFFLPERNRGERELSRSFRPLFVLPSAVLIGLISTLLGIGGGIFTVPFLTSFRIPLRSAISSSAATGFLIALFGAFSFFYLGRKESAMTEDIGYIALVPFAVIGISSFCFAPLGAKLAYDLPTGYIRRVFGVVLIIVGISIFLR